MPLGLHKNLTFNSGKVYPYATGGDYVYLYKDPTTGKTYRVHEFLSTGATATLNIEVGGTMEYLVVGGGGAGGKGSDGGGGGGAGGLTDGILKTENNDSLDIYVGSGGIRVICPFVSGSMDGKPSRISKNSSVLVETTGGGGGGYITSCVVNGSTVYYVSGGRNGGSGGGGRSLSQLSPGTGIAGQGYRGGTGNNQNYPYGAGGGGGGAGGEGESPGTTGPGGDGGIGVQWPENSGRYFAGGGAGKIHVNAQVGQGVGGLGGGGNPDSSGSPNTGGGGGGSSDTATNGGSGIVIVRYVVAEKKLWTPSELTGLQAWWDVSDESTLFNDTSGGSTPTNGEGTARWEDKSGNSRTLSQITSSERPTKIENEVNGLSVLRFANDRLDGSPFMYSLGGMTFAIVYKSSAAAQSFLVSEGRTTNNTPIYSPICSGGSSSIAQFFYRPDNGTVQVNYLQSYNWYSWNILTLMDSGSDIKYTGNGGTITSLTSSYTRSTTTLDLLRIGELARGTPNQFPNNADIGEIIVFDSVLSTTDRQKLEGYLAHKWGLTNNLPSGHPYKYEPPYKVEPEEIVTENLVFNVDSGDYASYPRKGTTWYDLSGNGNHMTLYNPTYYTYDSESNSLDFSRNTSLNTGGYAEKTSPTGAISSQTTFFAGDHSVEIWVRLNDIQPTYYYNNSLTTETQNALFVYRGYHAMFYSSASSLTYALIYSTNVYTGVGAPVILDYDLQGKWFHSIVVKSGSTLYMYVNGVLVSTRKLTSNTFRTESPVNLRISTGNDGSGSDFWRWYTESNVSAARMYTKALSSTEVTQNFNALKNRYGTASLSEPSGTVTNNLIVHLDAGNSSSYSGSGSTWTDLSGSGNNATLYNTPTYSSSNGGHLSFDGTNEYAQISASASTNLSSSSITVSVWAKSNTSTWSSYWSLVSKYNQFILGRNGQNEIAFLVHTTSGWQPTTYNNAIWGQSGTGFDNTQWHNYVGVYNSSANLTVLYIDGIAVAEVSTVGAVSSDTGPIDLMHREFDVVGTNHLAGSLSNVQIYNRALSSYEVLKNFNALRGRYGI